MAEARFSRDVRLEVYDIAQDPAMEGMLGIGWIRASNCMVNCNRAIVTLPEHRIVAEFEDAAIEGRGYTGHTLLWDRVLDGFDL